jgi:hypothetical protein
VIVVGQDMALTFVYLIVRQLFDSLALLARTDTAKTVEILLLRHATGIASSPLAARRLRIGLPRCRVGVASSELCSSEVALEYESTVPTP